MTIEQHKKDAGSLSVRCLVLTISDTRTMETDKSGKLIEEGLTASGHEVILRKVIPDEGALIRKQAEEYINMVDAIILNGGTGLAHRDVTIEAVEPLYQKTIDGFGELFRYLSYTEDIGPAAMLSRASAGISGKTVLFAMPGSSGAVKLGMEKLVLPELRHIVRELNKSS